MHPNTIALATQSHCRHLLPRPNCTAHMQLDAKDRPCSRHTPLNWAFVETLQWRPHSRFAQAWAQHKCQISFVCMQHLCQGSGKCRSAHMLPGESPRGKGLSECEPWRSCPAGPATFDVSFPSSDLVVLVTCNIECNSEASDEDHQRSLLLVASLEGACTARRFHCVSR